MSYKQGVYSKLIDRFADSGYAICELTITKSDKEGRSDDVILNGINRAMKRNNKFSMCCVKRNNKFYLLNKLVK